MDECGTALLVVCIFESSVLPFDDERDEDWDATRDRGASELTDPPDPDTGEGARVPEGVFGKL